MLLQSYAGLFTPKSCRLKLLQFSSPVTDIRRFLTYHPASETAPRLLFFYLIRNKIALSSRFGVGTQTLIVVLLGTWSIGATSMSTFAWRAVGFVGQVPGLKNQHRYSDEFYFCLRKISVRLSGLRSRTLLLANQGSCMSGMSIFKAASE